MTDTDRNRSSDAIHCDFFSCEQAYDPKIDISKMQQSKLFNVCLVVSGFGIHRVLNQEIPCSEGDICIIPPNIPHGYYLLSSDDTLTVRRLEFDIQDWFDGNTLTKDSLDYCYGVFNDNRLIVYATLNSYMKERVYSLYDYIECELLEQKTGHKELIKGYLTNLFINIARYVNSAIKKTSTASIKEWNIVYNVMNAVKERYKDSTLTLEAIAKDLFMSKSQLSRIFKKTGGMTFSDYLRSVRINNVCKALRQSNLNVAHIAKDCGFCDMNTFYKVFNSAVGMTPKQYRQALTQPKELSAESKKTMKEEKIMVLLSEISENLQKGKAKIVKELVQQALDEGSTPEQILSEGLLAGMNVVGEKFKNNEIYVPEVLVAARAMNAGVQILKPLLAAEGVEPTGRVCIGTVQGDLHDIGKNLVKMMMEGKGLEVIDLGTDVSPEVFIQTAIEQNCQVICCSALLTTTMGVMEDVVKAAEAAGIRDKVKIMVGGAPVSEDYCKKIGADCYTVDAASAADAAVEFCK